MPTSQSEAMEVDYGPALPPRLGADHPHDNASDQPSSLSDEPSKMASVRPKNQGSHCTGKTGKIVKSNSRQENTGNLKILEKYRENTGNLKISE